MYRHILIPTDGSVLANKAVRHGLSLAKSVGAKVTAVVVEPLIKAHDVSTLNTSEVAQAFDRHRDHSIMHAPATLSGVAAAARVAGVSCKTVESINDNPHEGIISIANELGCDLIVMASHGRSGLAVLMLGSVTRKVLTHTDIPVLVCH